MSEQSGHTSTWQVTLASGPAGSLEPTAPVKKKAKGSRLRLRLTRLMTVCILGLFVVGTSYWATGHSAVKSSLFAVGVTLAAFGAAGRAWATSYISGLKLKQLVRTGPYSLCRNPLYFFSFLLGVGFGFCTETLSMPLIIAVLLLALYHFQIRREEILLLRKFGEEYAAYLEQVPRFFPSFHNYCEPEQITVSPRLLKKGLFGIAFLLILIGVLELFRGLHETTL